MYAVELGLDKNIALDQVVVCPIPYPGWSDNNEQVSKANPLAKIPALVSDELPEDGLFDSRTICNYLHELAVAARLPDPWEGVDRKQKALLESFHACADGILDANTLITYENKIRAENGIKFQAWVDGQNTKINRALDVLNASVAAGKLPLPQADSLATVPEVAVAVALGRLDDCKTAWRTGRDSLAQWADAAYQRPSFQARDPRKNWNTGEPADIGFAVQVISHAG